jgi:cyanophycinase
MILESFLEKTRLQDTLQTKQSRGFLALIGGNEDKRDAKKVLRTVATLRQHTCVAVIPTASMYGRELGEEYVELFLKMNVGIAKGYVIDARTKEDVLAKPEYASMLAESDLIFFTGGDQVRLVQAFQETAAMNVIYERFLNGATIAGTSAGSAAASNPMIYDGDDEVFIKGAVQHTQGFGFLPNITMDTHFLQRSRIPRLAQFLAQRGSKYAIGLDEDTGIIVGQDNTCTVFGSAMVTFMHSKAMNFTDYEQVKNGTLYSVDGLGISFGAAGVKFDLAAWRVVE